MLDWLMSDIGIACVTAVTAVIAALIGIKWNGDYAKKLTACLEAGVMETYESYVRARKAANEDGKLTDEERGAARAMAIETAARYAQEQGLPLLREYAQHELHTMVEAIVRRFKGTTA